jgi:hypothetical protein
MNFATNNLDSLPRMTQLLQKQATFVFFLYKKCNTMKRKQWAIEVLMPILDQE